MIDFVHSDLFLQNSIPKKFFIISDTATITNTELHQEKFSLKEALCSESELVLGSCEASEIEFTVSNIFTPQTGKELTVRMVVNKDSNNPFNVGKYKVYSDKPTANRKDRIIKAYDAMHDIINSDVTDWYNRILPNGSAVTVKQFRDSFISYFGLEQEDITLINDDIILNRTIEPAKLSGKDVITKLCEMNGCFGHIGRNGKFKYIYLRPADEGLYPREDLYPSENLFPKETSDYWIPKRNCISASSEDYIVERITRIQIRQDEDDIGGGAGVEGNDYIIQDNFLLYGKDSNELNTIAQRILDNVGGIYYRPFNATVKGNPCAEVGDPILISGKYESIQSYVLERTLTGIQSLRDKISASGSPSREDKVNGSQSQIIQLQGKYNKLSRTVDETRSEIGNLETKTETRFIQTDNAILAEAKRASEAESSLRVTADQIQANVNTVRYDLNNNYYTITESDTKISASSDNILLSVSKTYETISNAGKKYNSLQSQIDINESNISLKVSSGEVQSMIDVSLENITLTANQINLDGYTRINGFSIDENGHARLRDGTAECYLSGNVLVVAQDGKYSYLSIFGLETDSVNTGAISCSSLVIGEYDAIHTGNISSYIPSTSGFVTYDELSTALGAFVPRTELSTTLASYPTYTALNNVLSEKGYATESWVNNKGYITSSYLYGYATEYWVTNQLSGYMTDSEFEFWENNTLDYKLGDLEDMYYQLEERISALEKVI